MRNRIMKSIPVMALLVLGGCTTLPAERTPTPPSSYRQSLDTEVMAYIETAANRNGAEVYWVNPPRKAKKD